MSRRARAAAEWSHPAAERTRMSRTRKIETEHLLTGNPLIPWEWQSSSSRMKRSVCDPGCHGQAVSFL